MSAAEQWSVVERLARLRAVPEGPAGGSS